MLPIYPPRGKHCENSIKFQTAVFDAAEERETAFYLPLLFFSLIFFLLLHFFPFFFFFLLFFSLPFLSSFFFFFSFLKKKKKKSPRKTKAEDANKGSRKKFWMGLCGNYPAILRCQSRLSAACSPGGAERRPGLGAAPPAPAPPQPLAPPAQCSSSGCSC